jgi:hypothetical protein
MLYGRARFQTSDPIDFTFNSIQEACKELGANIISVDDQNYRIFGKSTMLSRGIVSNKFYIILQKNGSEIIIEIYDGVPIIFNPARKFLEPFVYSISLKISFTTAYIIDKTEREFTNDGWILTKEDDNSIWNQIDPKLFKNFDYEIKVLEGDENDEKIKKIKRLTLRLEQSNFEIHLKKNNHSDPILVIPFRKIKEIKTIPLKRKYFLGIGTIVGLSISFIKNDAQVTELTDNNNPNTPTIEENPIDSLIISSGVTLYSLLEHLRILKEIDKDEKSRIRLLAMFNGVVICTNCYRNSSSFLFSEHQICTPCFKQKYGEIVLHVKNGEYYGGHKFHLAGGKLGDHEVGELYLTRDYLIFIKYSRDSQGTWDITIPLGSIIIEQWNTQQESRRTSFSGGGIGNEDFMVMGGLVRESGKRHRLVIPYIDQNGISHVPIFGVSSMSGKAIKEWAMQLYHLVSNHERTIPQTVVNSQIATEPLTDPLIVLKLRFAKGEINKQEYEEMKKLLE